MLELAIADWIDGRDRPAYSRRRRVADEARDWLFNPARAAHLTFNLICEICGTDAAAARAAIAARWGASMNLARDSVAVEAEYAAAVLRSMLEPYTQIIAALERISALKFTSGETEAEAAATLRKLAAQFEKDGAARRAFNQTLVENVTELEAAAIALAGGK